MQVGQRCVRRVHHVTISSITWFKAKHRVSSQNCSSGKWPRLNQGLMDHHSLVYTPLAPYLPVRCGSLSDRGRDSNTELLSYKLTVVMPTSFVGKCNRQTYTFAT